MYIVNNEHIFTVEGVGTRLQRKSDTASRLGALVGAALDELAGVRMADLLHQIRVEHECAF